MPLSDYSHVLTVGVNCTPVRQLRLAAAAVGLVEERIKGPFDWLVSPLRSVVEVCSRGFEGFFDPGAARIVGMRNARWRVLSGEGCLSVHQLQRAEGEVAVAPATWRQFTETLRARISSWESALGDPGGNVLLLRLEDQREPDSPDELAELARAICARARATITVAGVAYGEPRKQRHPQVLGLAVERSWPVDLPLDFVDWDFDYGFGPAWEGHRESWNRLWERV